MTIRSFFRRIEWRVNALRHRDPLPPRDFLRAFGGRRRRPWNQLRVPKRVVILRSDEIGDTVTTLTLLAAMRTHWPAAKLHLVVKPGPAKIFHATSTIDRLIPWSPITEGSALRRQLLTARQGLRRFGVRGYDLAVLPRWDFDDTPVRYLAASTRARSIVGFKPVIEREPVWFGDQSQLLTDVLPRGDDPLLTVQQLARVARHLGVPWRASAEPPVGRGLFDSTDLRRATELAGLPAEPGLVVSVGIGARDAKRQWPVEEIAESLAQLGENRPLTALILGGDADSPRAADLVARLRVRGLEAVDLAGRLSLSQSAAAISLTGLFLGNDSGLQHVSSSLDVPTLVVSCHPADGSPWSDNAPERFGPWSKHSALLQPDHAAPGCGEECIATEPHCIRAVHAGEAVAVAQALLEESAV